MLSGFRQEPRFRSAIIAIYRYAKNIVTLARVMTKLHPDPAVSDLPLRLREKLLLLSDKKWREFPLDEHAANVRKRLGKA